MISDEELKQFADICPESYMQTLKPVLEQANISVGDEFDGFKKIQEIAQELLQRREAERKANSWDDGSDWAVARRLARPSPAWIHYDEKAHKAILDGKIFLDTLEERPK